MISLKISPSSSISNIFALVFAPLTHVFEDTKYYIIILNSLWEFGFSTMAKNEEWKENTKNDADVILIIQLVVDAPYHHRQINGRQRKANGKDEDWK